jgi:superfamily I DNA/RNA helicase
MCANRFRQYCLDHNLLDFSLQLEVFANYLWRQDIVREYLSRTYRHLIYDNVEEDGPRAHDILREWLPSFDSALLIYDEGAGFRYFLGADVHTGWALRELCNEHVQLQDSFVMSEEVAGLSDSLVEAILPNVEGRTKEERGGDAALSIVQSHFYPELLDVVAGEVEQLISTHGIPPSEIVILAPYLSDALRFSITNRLEERNIPWRSHRPSRSLRDEPASHALITLAALAYPHWSVHPPKFDVTYALMQSIDGLDLVRAQLLTDIVYRQRDLGLSTFDIIKADVQERITFSIGNRYGILRDWLLAYRETDPLPLDHFLRKLFGEVLSQPGFGYHRNFDSVRVAASLVESVRKFRISLESDFRSLQDFGSLGREYIQMLQDGVIAASYLEGWQTEDKDAVLVAPAHTFLMMNRPVTVQFWLDIGSSGWYERLSQPLTHPFVLSRWWESGRVWSDADDVQYSRESLARLVSGLLHRCRERIHICLSELGESGFEQRGELLRAFQKVIQPS